MQPTIDHELLATVADWVAAARNVVTLTGAGISTASGIPDFRGPKGLWTTRPSMERLFSLDAYLAEAEVREQVWQLRLENPAFTAGPNPGHTALVELEQLGHLSTLVTQNVDGLHQLAGSDPDRVVEVHGTIHTVECLDCGRRLPSEPVFARVRAGDPDPRCEVCGGLQKCATISFGQSLDPATLQRAHDAAMGCDVMLAIGSSLVVHPVALLPRTALEAGARLVVINGEDTPYDAAAHAVLRSDIPATLTALVEQVRARIG